MHVELNDVLIEAVFYCFSEQSIPPTRTTIVNYIRKMHPDLAHPKLDAEVWSMLNRLVDGKRLVRVGGLGIRRYVLGDLSKKNEK